MSDDQPLSGPSINPFAAPTSDISTQSSIDKTPEEIIREFGITIVGHIPYMQEQKLRKIPKNTMIDIKNTTNTA